MKKIVCGILVAAMAVTVGTASAFAAEVNSSRARCFVDANEDGVCDHYGIRGMGFVDANEDGVCDHYGICGMGFVDANGDGVCDNYGMRGSGFGMGNHCGRNR